jgi:hypothetical protein
MIAFFVNRILTPLVMKKQNIKTGSMKIASCLVKTLSIKVMINAKAYPLLCNSQYLQKKYAATIINASVGTSVITILEEATTNGVVINIDDEKKAMFSSYIILINRNHMIPASTIKKTMVNLAENTETPNTV